MNRIEQLIEELCPDGVEFRELWEVTAWDKKFNGLDKYMQKKIINYPYVLANKFKELELERGDVRLLSTGNYIGWTTEELAGKHLCHGEIVAIPWGGKANVKYYKGKFVTADNRIATSIDTTVLLNKFLYYWMLVNTELIESFYRGAGIKHPSMKSVLTMKIPIPPLPIQQEIVTILDTFTALDASLQAELEARRKQYEHYRNQLLNFEGKEVEWKTLGGAGGIAEIGTGSRNTVDAIENGKYPFYVRSANILLIDHYEFDEEAILTSGDGVGVGKILHYVNGKYSLHQRAYRFRMKHHDISTKYVFYYMKNTFEKFILGSAVNSSVTSVRRPMLEKYKIPIPSLSEQERIVGILDKFDALVNTELSAEIAARRKQYEYYREKLLTFEPLAN